MNIRTALVAMAFMTGLAGAMPVLSFDSEPIKLDRLFTTPAERQELDNIRATYRPGDIRIDAVAGPQSVTVNGVLLRSDGRNVAWINGKSSVMGPTGEWEIDLDAVDTEAGAKLPVALSGTLRSYELQPGQTLEAGTGKLRDSWQQPPPEPDLATR